MGIDPNIPTPVLPPIPEGRFKSMKDTLAKTYLKALYARDISERVSAAQNFLAQGVNILMKTAASKDKELAYAKKLGVIQANFHLPLIRRTIDTDPDGHTVMVLEAEGIVKSKHVVPPALALQEEKTIKEEMYTQLYFTLLVPMVQHMAMKLMEYDILRRDTLQNKVQFDFMFDEDEFE